MSPIPDVKCYIGVISSQKHDHAIFTIPFERETIENGIKNHIFLNNFSNFFSIFVYLISFEPLNHALSIPILSQPIQPLWSEKSWKNAESHTNFKSFLKKWVFGSIKWLRFSSWIGYTFLSQKLEKANCNEMHFPYIYGGYEVQTWKS